MQRMIFAALAAVFFSPALAVTTDTPGVTFTVEEQAVMAVEDDWIHAEVAKDEATLRRVLDERFVFNQNNGQLSGKEDLIEGVLGGSMTGQTLSERSVMIDGDTAVIFGTTEIRFGKSGEAETASLLRYTTVYVKRDREWRAVALHMARRTPD